jgi:hypothetical protein
MQGVPWRKLISMVFDLPPARQSSSGELGIDLVARSERSAAVLEALAQANVLADADVRVRILLLDGISGSIPLMRSWARVLPHHARSLFDPAWTYACVGEAFMAGSAEDSTPVVRPLTGQDLGMHRLAFDAAWVQSRPPSASPVAIGAVRRALRPPVLIGSQASAQL